MALYEKTPIIQGDGDPYILIPAGQNTFIDTELQRFMGGLATLFKLFTKEEVLETIEDGHGNVLVSFRGPPVDVHVPASFAGAHTGYFYQLPTGQTLNQVGATLYGPEHATSLGFWRWLADEFPDTFRATKAFGEGVVETAQAIKRELSLGALVAGGLVVGVLLVVLVAKRR